MNLPLNEEDLNKGRTSLPWKFLNDPFVGELITQARTALDLKERLEEYNKWLHVFAKPCDGEDLIEALKREHGVKYDIAYGWEKDGRTMETETPSAPSPIPEPYYEIPHPGTLEKIKCETFEYAMDKWFEGFNIPVLVVNGEREPFGEATKRVREYFKNKSK